MLVLFIECWGSNLSIQAGVGKLNDDLHQPFGIRYESRSFSVRYLVSLAYRKGLISGVKLSVVVPQAIGIYLCNRIGDSAREFLVVVLWGWYSQHSMYLNCSFSLVYVSGLGACMPGRFWLEWSLSQPSCLPCFMHLFFLYAGFWFTVAYTRGFLCCFRIYMQVYYEQSCIPLILSFLGR